GNTAVAESHYLAALKSAREGELAVRISLGLARVLLKKGPASPEVSARPAASTLAVLLTSLLVGGMTASAADPDVEALRTAEKAIAGDNPRTKAEGHLLRAQVYTKQGRWRDALADQIAALKLLAPPEYRAGLETALANSFSTMEPRPVRPPRPAEAEPYYAEGRLRFFACDFASAESLFQEAVRLNNEDARHFYFLGLARMLQGQLGGASQALKIGPSLKAKNKPNPRLINNSLERIQGVPRANIELYRP